MNEDEIELLEEEFDEGTQQSIDEFISNINLEEDNDLTIPNGVYTEEFIDTVLEDVYQQTNNINGRWIDNARVICYRKPLEGKGHRSTSVGDTIALHTEDGRYLYYRVASFGFDKI